MRMPALLSKNTDALPGVTGTARVDRNTQRLLKKIGRGDIAVLDALDLDRITADRLVAAGVAAVVNASPSVSGRYPNLGPDVLVAHGIVLIDVVSSDVFAKIKDGAKVRVSGGVVYSGRITKKEPEALVEGIELTRELVAERMVEARNGIADHLAAFAGNTVEYIRTESAQLIDGVGIPELELSMQGRQVVIVADGPDTVPQLKRLKPYMREHVPIVVGVGRGADTVRRCGYEPDLIVGDPDEITAGALKCGAEVILPADTDGHAKGLERIQDLGIGATTFPSSGSPADLALLLADHNGAELIVTVGAAISLDDFFDRSRLESSPATFLTRVKASPKLIDAAAVALLYRNRAAGWAVALMVLAAMVAMVAALVATSTGGDLLDWTVTSGHHVLTRFHQALNREG